MISALFLTMNYERGTRNFGMFLLPKNILIILKCNGCSNENLKGAEHLDAEGVFRRVNRAPQKMRQHFSGTPWSCRNLLPTD